MSETSQTTTSVTTTTPALRSLDARGNLAWKFAEAFTAARELGFNVKTAAPGLPGPSGPYVIGMKDLTFEPIGACLDLPLVKERATSA